MRPGRQSPEGHAAPFENLLRDTAAARCRRLVKGVYRFVEVFRPELSDAPLTFAPLIGFAGLAFDVLGVTLVPVTALVAFATNPPVAALRVADPRIRYVPPGSRRTLVLEVDFNAPPTFISA